MFQVTKERSFWTVNWIDESLVIQKITETARFETNETAKVSNTS